MRFVVGIGLVGMLVGAAHPRGTPAAAYHVVERIRPGGEGGWDYLTVDPGAHRLYVSRSTRVQVIDLGRDSLIGEIANTPGVHGIALAHDLGRGFTSNGRDSSVTIFDLGTLAVTGVVRLDARFPDDILYEPVTHRVFTFNGGSNSATAIDAASGTVVGTVTLGGRPEAAVTDGRGTVYVNLEDSSAVVAFDARTLVTRARWPLAPGEEPTGLAIDVAHGRLFSGCGNQTLVVLDTGTGRVVATVPIGHGVDGVAFDAARGLAFSTNGADSSITVVHERTPDHFEVVQNVPTQRGARTVALDPSTHRLYTSTASFGPPPAPTAERPHPRPSLVPGSFVVLVVAP